MKRFFTLLFTFILCISFAGCAQPIPGEIAATTLPVFEFTQMICQGTGLTVTRLITENVSCLHNYTLKVSQMQAIENATVIVTSGAGLEDFLEDALSGTQQIIDASSGIELLCSSHDHDGHEHDHNHSENNDPHIWLSVANAKKMSHNIFQELSAKYPQHQAQFKKNLVALDTEFSQLEDYASKNLSNLSSRKLITFHDGFSYMAASFDLEIVYALEEESGSEASAQELIELIRTVEQQDLKAIFTERNGSTSAANILCAETNIPVYSLDMAMSGDSYFDAMYHNIDTLKEALQ